MLTDIHINQTDCSILVKEDEQVPNDSKNFPVWKILVKNFDSYKNSLSSGIALTEASLTIHSLDVIIQTFDTYSMRSSYYELCDGLDKNLTQSERALQDHRSTAYASKMNFAEGDLFSTLLTSLCLDSSLWSRVWPEFYIQILKF